MTTHTEAPPREAEAQEHPAAGDGRPQHGRLRHHFDTLARQFDSSKLGMWLFLATELLMFGGLFCAYAVYRGNHPEIFDWGSRLLDRRLGMTNTMVLITSSFTMAAAVFCAQRGWRWRQVVFLTLTFLGACGFLGIKAVEYAPKFRYGLLWGTSFDPDPEYVAARFGGGHGEAVAAAYEESAFAAAEAVCDLERGKAIALETCASCHGAELRGMERNGKSLVESAFVAARSDAEVLAFLKVGRQPFDPENTTGVGMPARGGNPTLDDGKLADVIAFLRVLQAGAAEAAEGADAVLASVPAGGEAEIEFPKSVVPLAPPGPAGLAPAALGKMPDGVPAPAANAHRFFGIYFLMTGLHGVHVLAGGLLIGWLILGAALGRYGAAWYTPVDLVGLFWHVVDLIWIFLFPLFYLI
jgi:cytochrome c oxidase subunit 3